MTDQTSVMTGVASVNGVAHGRDLNFDDLQPVEIPFRYNDNSYVLREPSEGTVCQWRNHTMRAARLNEGKIVGIEGAADGDPLLVSLCLVQIVEQSSGKIVEKPVPVNIVRGWPSRVVKKLYAKVREIGDLDVEEASETEESLEKRIELIESVLNDRVKALKEKVAELKKNGAEPGDTMVEALAKNE